MHSNYIISNLHGNSQGQAQVRTIYVKSHFYHFLINHLSADVIFDAHTNDMCMCHVSFPFGILCAN